MSNAAAKRISIKNYPALDVEIFVRGIVAAAKRYYEDPAHEAGYREWLAAKGKYEDENGHVHRINEGEP